MNKLDQLAKVLGVMVTSEVSVVPLPSKKGRPKRGNKMVEDFKITRSTADQIASEYAKQAYEDHFSSRRGVWVIEALQLTTEKFLLYYNNNPYSFDSKARDSEMSRIKKRLKEMAISTLSVKSYGGVIDGSDHKYTVTMLFDCNDSRIEDVENVINEEVGKTKMSFDR